MPKLVCSDNQIPVGRGGLLSTAPSPAERGYPDIVARSAVANRIQICHASLLDASEQMDHPKAVAPERASQAVQGVGPRVIGASSVPEGHPSDLNVGPEVPVV